MEKGGRARDEKRKTRSPWRWRSAENGKRKGSRVNGEQEKEEENASRRRERKREKASLEGLPNEATPLSRERGRERGAVRFLVKRKRERYNMHRGDVVLEGLAMCGGLCGS